MSVVQSAAFVRALQLRVISRARASLCVSLRCCNGHSLDFICASLGYKRSFVRRLCELLRSAGTCDPVIEEIADVILQPLQEEQLSLFLAQESQRVDEEETLRVTFVRALFAKIFWCVSVRFAM
jgi:hypothetical protein